MMHQRILLWILLVGISPSLVLSGPRHQFKVPRHLSNDLDVDDEELSSKVAQNNDESPSSSDDSIKRLRSVLRLLLDLDDEGLSDVINGVPEQTAEVIQPSSSLFLQANKNRLQKLQSLVYNEAKESSTPHLVDGNNQLNLTTLSDVVGKELEDVRQDLSQESDTLLAALTQLSSPPSSFKKSHGSSRKHLKKRNKRKRHSHHFARKEAYYSYWLKSGTCPKTPEGLDRVYCPTPSKSGDWVCVDDQELCDGYSHCPNDEDEDPKACLFYKTVHNYLEFLTTAVLTAIRRH